MVTIASIFLFTGENAFALREEKARWIDEFSRKYGTENLIRLDGKSLSFRSLLDEIAVAPFLAPKRLVVVEGVPKYSREEIASIEQHIHPQTVLLFIDPKLDRRTVAAKELLAAAEVKTFGSLDERSLSAWVLTMARDAGGRIEPDAAKLLIDTVGEEQEALLQEITKLCLFAGTRAITRADVEEMALPLAEGVVWTMTDLLSNGKKEEAARYARRLITHGGDAYGVWAILLHALRNLVAVSTAVKSGITDTRTIATEYGLHPFAVRSILSYARRADAAAIRSFLDRTVATDIGLKTGAYRATDEAPEELLCLIDRFILTAP